MLMFRVLSRLPLPALRWLGHLLFVILYYVTGYRKPTVRDNLARSFPKKNENELTVLEKNCYRQLTQVIAEVLHIPRMSLSEFRNRVEIVNIESLSALRQETSRPLLFLGIHQGNWEWVLHGLAAHLGRPVDALYKPLHHPGSDAFLRALRCQHGAQAIPVKALTRRLLRNQQQPSALAILADQAPVPHEPTVWCEFFGRNTPFHSGYAKLAIRAGAQVVFVQCQRYARGRYRVHLHLLGIAGTGAISDDASLVQRYARMAETAISAEPESWLWTNRRWKRAGDAIESASTKRQRG